MVNTLLQLQIGGSWARIGGAGLLMMEVGERIGKLSQAACWPARQASSTQPLGPHRETGPGAALENIRRETPGRGKPSN